MSKAWEKRASGLGMRALGFVNHVHGSAHHMPFPSVNGPALDTTMTTCSECLATNEKAIMTQIKSLKGPKLN